MTKVAIQGYRGCFHEQAAREFYSARGEEISIGARIVSLADVYDALLSERAYKKAFSREKAYQMIMDGECGVFHPRLIQAFEDAREDLEQCANEIIE